MKKFIIEEPIFRLFPDVHIGIIVFKGVDNRIKAPNKYLSLLQEAEIKSQTFLTEEEFGDNPVIAIWRDALTRFKKKKGVRASIDALMKRVANGNHIGTINPFVDIYNAISLSYALPVGGEDIDTFDGDIRLTIADGTEPFITLGSNKSEPPKQGEVIYKDNSGAICRCWNWRESVRTMLTENTTHAVLCIECIDKARIPVLEEALEKLETIAAQEVGGTHQRFILNKERPEVIISD